MLENPYLIALALVEQEGSRSLPLGGKSLKTGLLANSDPGQIGQTLVLQLLLRIFQKSGSAPLKIASESNSILLIEIPMNSMQESLPLLKAKWLQEGNNEQLILDLHNECKNIWSVSFSKGEGINFSKLLKS